MSSVPLPKSSGWYMPAEWAPHTRCWMLWPHRLDVWRKGAAPAREAFSAVIKAIARFEPVVIGVRSEDMHNAKQHLNGLQNVKITKIDSNDAWMRDMGPTFLLRKSQAGGDDELSGVDWQFNAWGGLYNNYTEDNKVASNVLAYCSDTIKQGYVAPFVMDGGSFHVDGEGTVLTTEECLLNPNRNPHMSKAEIELALLNYLGAEKVIWLPRGLTADEDTNGHIDNIACFAAPAKVILSWTDDQSDPQFAISREALAVLQSTPDARGRNIEVIKIQIPPAMYRTEDDMPVSNSAGGFDIFAAEHIEETERTEGERLAASYANFYIAGEPGGLGGIVCPAFGAETDALAAQVLTECFPGREIVMVPCGREIVLGGGNIHCITQQQPACMHGTLI